MIDVRHHVQNMVDQGRRVLGCLPLYPPVELFHSMGLTPVVLWGATEPLRKSDAHLQPFACSIARNLTELIVAKKDLGLAGLFGYNACDTLRNLPEILACGSEQYGRELPFLSMHLPLAYPDRTVARAYLKKQVEGLIRKVEEVFDTSFSEDRFATSIALYAQTRELARTIDKNVSAGQLPFSTFASAYLDSTFLPVEDQVTALRGLLADCLDAPDAATRDSKTMRTVISGIFPPPRPVMDTIEKLGFVVAGNDLACMTRSFAYSPWLAASPGLYYQDFYSSHYPCTTLPYLADRRVQTMLNLVHQRNATSVIFAAEKYCEYENFEIPYLVKRLNEAGVKTLVLEFAAQDDGKNDTAVTRLEALAEVLAGDASEGTAR